MNTTFRRIGIVGKYGSQDLGVPLEKLIAFLRSFGADVVLDNRTAAIFAETGVPSVKLKDISAHADLVVVLGGDGTMLSAARALACQNIPMIGINLGQLGFLTDIRTQSMEKLLGEVLNGEYHEETRTLLKTNIVRSGEILTRRVALNDVVLTKGARGSMIDLEVYVDGRFVYNLRADGLIVSTPTGSTAYALSSGGPILHPDLAAIALVPICPHTLSNRPIALSDHCTVEVLLQKGEGAFANFDVQDHVELKAHDRLVITAAENGIRLLHPLEHSYFAMLREKLGWGAKL
jgi:NAD+ kinase